MDEGIRYQDGLGRLGGQIKPKISFKSGGVSILRANGKSAKVLKEVWGAKTEWILREDPFRF